MATQSETPFTVAFYDPATYTPDGEGRTLNTILAFSDAGLESHHDFIQYLFPLPERSPINPSAPVLNPATRDAFLKRPDLRKSLFRAVVRMCRFYGFEVTTATSLSSSSKGEATREVVEVFVRPTADPATWRRNSRLWRTAFSHNHLRITRMIRCLRVLGLVHVARGFQGILLANDSTGAISSRTKMFWDRAARRELHLAPEEEDDGARGVAWLREGGGGDGDGEGGFDAQTGRMVLMPAEEVDGV